MEDYGISFFHKLADIYKDLGYVSPEWVNWSREQLLQAAEENMMRVSALEKMEKIMIALHGNRFGDIPQVPEDDLVSCRNFDQALECVRNEQSNPFVLDPPKGPLAIFRGPKKEDYYSLGYAIQFAKYHFEITAVRQRAYASYFYTQIPQSLKEFESFVSAATENSPLYKKQYERYEKPAGDKDHIYIGDVIQNIEYPERMDGYVKAHFDRFLEEAGVKKGSLLRIPCSYRAGKPFVLFVNQLCPIDDTAAAKKTIDFLHNVIYQVIHAMPAYSYRFVYMDPQNAGKSLEELQGLTGVKDGNAFWLHPRLYNNEYSMFDLVTSKYDFDKMMTSLIEIVGSINTIKGAVSSVAEYNAGMFDKDGSWKDEAQIIPQQFIIIENIHEHLSADTCQKMETLINNAQECGISLILVSRRQRSEGADEFEKRLMRNRKADVIDWAPEGVSISSSNALLGEQESGTFRYGFAPFCADCTYPDYISSITQELKPNLNVNTHFIDLFDIEKLWGKGDATEEIRVPAGVNQRGKITDISFGGSAVSGLLAGTTGCGKSWFLHELINWIVMYYSPEDVELWLSDYKTVEFKRYMKNTPRNITYVGTARTKEYSLALIDKIYAEYDRRSLLFGADSVTSVKEYRELHGKDSMPRLLVIIDEFHVMSNHIKDEPEYSTKLASILREARAMGIGMLLSDQTCGVGLNGLKEDAKLQLNNRMAMRTNIDEYNSVFDIKNASQVIPEIANYEIVLKRETAGLDENGHSVVKVFYEHCKTIYTPPEVRDLIAKKSIETYGANDNLFSITSDLRAPADWDEIFKEAEKDPLRRGFGLYPGIPKDLRAFVRIRMTDGYNENLMSIGSDNILQAEVMIHLIESVRRSGMKLRVIFIASENDDVFAASESWINDFCRKYSFAQILTDEEEICRCIAELYDEMDAGRRRKQIEERTFVVWMGMPDICRDMEHFAEERPAALKNGRSTSNAAQEKSLEAMFDTLFGTSDLTASEDDQRSGQEEESDLLYNAAGEIRGLLDEGPRRGIHSLVFNSAVSVSRRIKCAGFEYFNHKIAFRMSRDEAMDYLGNSRVIMTPENEIIDEETGVYFDGKSGVRFVPFIDEAIENK